MRWSRGSRPSLLAVVALTVILTLTGILSVAVDAVNDANENRLERLQTRQLATLAQSFIQNLATPLASAAEIAAVTGGDSPSFRRYAAAFRARSHFESLSLWSVTPSTTHLVTVAGHAPHLGTSGPAASTFLRRAAAADTVAVNDVLAGTTTLIGFAHGSLQGTTRYVVYVESELHPRTKTTVSPTSPFAGVRFGLYFGRTPTARHLLVTSESTPTVRGHTTSATVAFGTATLTLVVAARRSLGGEYVDQRWWLVLVVGGVVALGAGVLTDRLVKRRRRAEALTAEIDALLRDQRSIADTLQRALVPDGLPAVRGVELAARYLPGVHGVEIGGDWYDVVPVDDTHVFFAIGDVSGRGLEAGSVMASLHFAIRAYASEGHDPATVLHLLGGLLALSRDRHYATVLCGCVDTEAGVVTVANAGHLPMLVVGGAGETRFLQAKVGPPIGIQRGVRYEATTVELPAGATLLLYTDGLVEHRGESLDDGLGRLRAAASRPVTSTDALLTSILAELRPDGCDDDTAVLALRLEHRTADTKESAR